MSISDNTVSGNELPNETISGNEVEKPVIPVLPDNAEITDIVKQLYNALCDFYKGFQSEQEFKHDYIIKRNDAETQKAIESELSISVNSALEIEYRENVLKSLSEIKESNESVSDNSVSANSVSCNVVLDKEFKDSLNVYMETNTETLSKISDNSARLVDSQRFTISILGLLLGILVGISVMRWFK